MVNKSNLRNCLGISMFLLAVAGLAQAAITTVGPGAAYDFISIQAGIDAATAGDTILVAPGEYVITEPITFRGKAITVRSEAGRDETTIQMGTPTDPNRGSVVVFENNETAASVLEGFTITGGSGSWVKSALWGGGIFFNASSGTVRNCAVVQNRADGGGGVLVGSGSSAILMNCNIGGNVCTEELGGGVLCGGFGPSEKSYLTMANCIVGGNTSEADGGGGVAGWYGSLTLTRCAILSNTAGNWFGGGVYAGHSSVTLTNCVIARNAAPLGGGGVCSSYSDASIVVSNCTIWGNSAGSVCGGGGVLCRNASATVTNSIIWGNTAPKGREISVQDSPSTLTITYSSVLGGQAGVSVEGSCTLDWGVGNIDADPLFADPANDDYYLRSQAGRWDLDRQTWIQDDVTSPCINAGDPMSPIGLEPFPNGGFINMGACGGTPEASKTYFGEPICGTIVAGDINGDCQVNRADLEIMALHWTDDEPLLP